MSLVQRLRGLDSRVFTSLRQPGEPAEQYLRRVAARRWPTDRPAAFELQQALREYFAELDK